jgi:hypothetical protein
VEECGVLILVGNVSSRVLGKREIINKSTKRRLQVEPSAGNSRQWL